MSKVRTAEMSWREVEEVLKRDATVIVPMGSTEEHGPVSPMGDYLITDTIAEQVARATGSVMIPTIPFSYSETYRHYPGTITVQAETLRLLVRDTVYSLLDQGFKRIVLFNGHAGNEPILQILVREFRRERQILIPHVAPIQFGVTPELRKELYGSNPTGHGGEPIASFWTYLRPELVDASRAEDWGVKDFLGHKSAGLDGIHFEGRIAGFALNMEDVTPPSGSLSSPSSPSAERGEKFVRHSIDGLTKFVNWFSTIDPTIAP